MLISIVLNILCQRCKIRKESKQFELPNYLPLFFAACSRVSPHGGLHRWPRVVTALPLLPNAIRDLSYNLSCRVECAGRARCSTYCLCGQRARRAVMTYSRVLFSCLVTNFFPGLTRPLSWRWPCAPGARVRAALPSSDDNA